MPRKLRQPVFMKLNRIETIGSDYSVSKDRLDYLNLVAELGEKAQTLKEFTEGFLDDEEATLLEQMKRPNVDLELVYSNYLAALRLADKILGAISLAERKKAPLQRLRQKFKRSE